MDTIKIRKNAKVCTDVKTTVTSREQEWEMRSSDFLRLYSDALRAQENLNFAIEDMKVILEENLINGRKEHE